MTQFNLTLNQEETDFIIKKMGLSPESHLSLALQLKKWILNPENVSDVDNRYKELRNDKTQAQTESIKLDVEIKKRTLSYQDTFDSNPSRQAQSAIKKGVESRNLTDSEYENVMKYITLKNHNFKWESKCDLCKDGDTFQTRLEAVKGMIYHLSTEHSKKVMEMR